MKPTPVLTATDAVVIGLSAKGEPHLLLIQRLNNPFKNSWALPGGFLDPNEDLKACALRELREETGIILQDMIQIGAYGHPARDPRGRVISIAFGAITDIENHVIKAADDAKSVSWFALSKLPELAFDHHLIIKDSVQKLL